MREPRASTATGTTTRMPAASVRNARPAMTRAAGRRGFSITLRRAFCSPARTRRWAALLVIRGRRRDSQRRPTTAARVTAAPIRTAAASETTAEAATRPTRSASRRGDSHENLDNSDCRKPGAQRGVPRFATASIDRVVASKRRLRISTTLRPRSTWMARIDSPSARAAMSTVCSRARRCSARAATRRAVACRRPRSRRSTSPRASIASRVTGPLRGCRSRVSTTSRCSAPARSCHNGARVPGKPVDHILASEQCDDCHRSIAWTPATFDHAGITAGCFGCHNGIMAMGKPVDHIPATNVCEDCHRVAAFSPVARVDHFQVLGVCSGCHNNTIAMGQQAGHIPTTAECNTCHNTTAWR